MAVRWLRKAQLDALIGWHQGGKERCQREADDHAEREAHWRAIYRREFPSVWDQYRANADSEPLSAPYSAEETVSRVSGAGSDGEGVSARILKHEAETPMRGHDEDGKCCIRAQLGGDE